MTRHCDWTWAEEEGEEEGTRDSVLKAVALGDPEATPEGVLEVDGEGVGVDTLTPDPVGDAVGRRDLEGRAEGESLEEAEEVPVFF